MTTPVLPNYTEVRPVEDRAEWWLNLLSGKAQRSSVNGANGHYAGNGVNGHYRVNGTNGAPPVQAVYVEPLPPYWLNLLSGGRNYNGNSRGPVSTPLPAVEIDAEFWLKMLAGK